MEMDMMDATSCLLANYLTKIKNKNSLPPSKPFFHEASAVPVPAPAKYYSPKVIESAPQSSDEEGYYSRTRKSRIKNISPHVLSSFGLMLVPCAKPKTPSKPVRKAIRTEKSSIPQFKPNRSNASPECAKKKIRPSSSELSRPVNKMLCVTVQGAKDRMNSHEIMTDLRDYQRLRKSFPKLGDVIPDVDADEKEMKFSADAVKSVLGFLLSPSYNFSAVRNEMIAVEILALIRLWEVVKFQARFTEHFLKNILKERNACKIYSYASHYGLDDIRDACLALCQDPSIRKYKQKSSTISVCTYVDPEEFCIPLQPISENLSESFDKDILNDLVFESLSGTHILTGIQIRLNISDADKEAMTGKVNIHYCCESQVEDLNIPQKTVSKPMSSSIIINFKKKIVVDALKKVKISIEIPTKPCRCYVLTNDSKLNNENFNVSLTSNRKAQFSDKSLFVIAKIYYHSKAPSG